MSDDSQLRHPDPILLQYLLLHERMRLHDVGGAMIKHHSEGFFARFLDRTQAKGIAIQRYEDEKQSIAADRTAIAQLVCDRMNIPMQAGIRKFGAPTDDLERHLPFYEWWAADSWKADTPLWAGPRPWERKFETSE